MLFLQVLVKLIIDNFLSLREEMDIVRQPAVFVLVLVTFQLAHVTRSNFCDLALS